VATEQPKKTLNYRAITPIPTTADENTRSVEAVISTEIAARVFDAERWEIIDEVLLQRGMQVYGGGKQVPILDAHDSGSTESVLGSARDMRQEGDKTIARVYFSRKQRAQDAYNDVADGHITSVSVGYRVLESVWIPEGTRQMVEGREYVGPIQVSTRWELHEVSLVPVPADAGAKFREAAPEQVTSGQLEAGKIIEEESQVENPNKTPETTQSTPPASAPDLTQVRAEAAKAEQDRILSIRKACSVPGCEDMVETFITAGTDISTVREKVIERMATKAQPLSTPRVEDVITEGTKFRAAASDAMLMGAMGSLIKSPAAGADQLRHMGFEGIARECLHRAGVDTRYMGKAEIFSRSLNKRAMPNHSTSDFDYICASAASSAAKIGYNQAPSTYQLWTRIGSIPDFKAARRVALSDAPNMLEVKEGGEIQYGSMSDSGVSISLVTYARKLGITRQALYNDDLSLFDSIFRAFGARAGNLVNSLPYALIVANGTFISGNLFNTTALSAGGHDNMADSGGAISGTTLATGIAHMFAQTAPNGSKMNIQPRYLLTGGNYKTQADIMCGSLQLADATFGSNVKNPFNTLAPIADANITGNKWFLVGDPAMFDTIEVSFLNGVQSPTITSVESSDILGLVFTGFIDATASVLDYRAMFYNAGG
jgi:phage head maturation protease